MLERDLSVEKKYNKLRLLFAKLFKWDAPVIKTETSAKEKVVEALPIFKKILYDEDTPKLFKWYMLNPTSSLGKTDDFLQFLAEISK